MRKLALVLASVFLAILLFVPSPASAAPANLVATTGIPTKLYGDATLKARSAALSIEGTDQLPTFQLDAERLDVEIVRVVSEYVPVAAGIEAMGQRRSDVTTRSFDDASLALTRRAPDLVLVVDGGGASVVTHQTLPAQGAPSDLWTRADAQLGILLVPATYAAPLPALLLAQSDESRDDSLTFDAGLYTVSAHDASAQMTRVDRVLGYGATFRIDAPEGGHVIESGRSVATMPGSLLVDDAWIGPGSHVEETVTYLVATPVDGILDVSSAALALHASDVFVLHHGFLGLPWAEGSLTTTDETFPMRGQQAVLGGELRLRPVGASLQGAPRLTLLGDGDLHYVQVGPRAAGLEAAEAAATAGGVAAGLSLLAALVYFWPVVKYGAGLALFPLYARVSKEQTLDHKGRELLYDLIKNEPGVSTNHLARQVQFGWSTLTYHLRVLERNEAIVSVRDGRYKRFFDRASGRFSNGRKYILAVLKNDSTLHIARFIREKPGSSQKEVAGTFRLSPSSVHWHVERLSEVGLVQKVREAHHVKYFPGEGWDHVTIDDLKAVEARPGSPAPQVVGVPGSSDATPTARGL